MRGAETLMTYLDVISFIQLSKLIQWLGLGNGIKVLPHRDAEFFRFLSKMEGVQETFDNVSRCHKLSYEVKAVEIDPVVGAGKRYQGSSP
ncbi:hypothetical protein AVEN_137005-1 [Araneus ventricosus]|uniref:Uncharacterized protein n=1 Tax=Araneus ventricosus TaxID=182803 RepID=A0A4Y2R5F3_ARAVE|nr:hypothetical protein AVEN_137005-1 [Araneus ventricosus]